MKHAHIAHIYSYAKKISGYVLLIGYIFVAIPTPLHAQVNQRANQIRTTATTTPTAPNRPAQVSEYISPTPYIHMAGVSCVMANRFMPNIVVSTRQFVGIPGTYMDFNVVISTTSAQIIDGKIELRIVRATQSQGFEEIGRVLVAEAINLPVGISEVYTVSWKVPDFIAKGDYAVIPYFTSELHRGGYGTNIYPTPAGLRTRISLQTNDDIVGLSDTPIRINNKVVQHMTTRPIQLDTRTATITATIVNESKAPREITVRAHVYAFNITTPESKIETQEKTVLLKGQSSQVITFAITDANHPLYTVVLESQSASTQIRREVVFIRDGVPGARIGIVAPVSDIDSTKRKNPSDIFSGLYLCINQVPLIRTQYIYEVFTSVTSGDGTLIATSTFSAGMSNRISDHIMNIGQELKDEVYTLNSKLLFQGKVIDEAQINLSCEEILGRTCTNQSLFKIIVSNYILIIISFIVLIIILSVGILIRRSKKKQLVDQVINNNIYVKK